MAALYCFVLKIIAWDKKKFFRSQPIFFGSVFLVLLQLLSRVSIS